MIRFYLSTIIIWMIIIYCTASMLKDAIKKKINTNEPKKKMGLFKKLSLLFTLSAVPIIRVFVEIFIIYIALCKKEDFDELIKKANEENQKYD